MFSSVARRRGVQSIPPLGLHLVVLVRGLYRRRLFHSACLKCELRLKIPRVMRGDPRLGFCRRKIINLLKFSGNSVKCKRTTSSLNAECVDGALSLKMDGLMSTMNSGVEMRA